ncbi:hypothetical protein DOTSEDRAFT_68942 [Dothistroma septosporum NZE10]|uniref:BZIP domain-containing protein n=1 Tax=Dothistroma septosporum (strain NZE10 / CBS 128990) TaxID=675120 RepID=N1Q3I0_DOTSN|nr:hypothetical protein DOTSEDRAFT_68942 [Dothistroma septosporum NZE10]
MGDSSILDGDMAAPSKVEPAAEGTPSSIESTPEPEAGVEPSQEPAQPQKRKGGRKPIYATSEERKQRNRQAQAAFRERRTEYIKQLEATIKQNEETLASLQRSHRAAADECLMLRYKNSLLERILLEKGIDVQTELQMKTGSPVLGPGFMHPAPSVPPQPQLQRTALQRQQARRSGQSYPPKLAPGQSSQDMNFVITSPHAHPTPSSHASSPSQLSTRSPMTMHQGGMTPPASAVLAQPQAQHLQKFGRSAQQHPNQAFYQSQQQPAGTQRPPRRPTLSNYQGSTSGLSSISAGSQNSMPQSLPAATGGSAGPQAASAFYPSPFQKHFDQLDQEYDTQHSRSMLDETEPEDIDRNHSPELHGTYPPQFEQGQGHQHGAYYEAQSGVQHGQQQPLMQPTSHPNAEDGSYDVDPNDPMLDADPFGLSASMHYPTSYSYDPHGHR